MDSTARAALLDRVAALDWYQRIPLGDGASTPGDDDYTQVKLPMLGIPEGLDGRSVLDIGCSEGFFAFEAERRGARRVLGIDRAAGLAEKFALVKQLLGSGAEYREMDVLDLAPTDPGVFDLVICLSVLQHLRYPYLALDRIAAVTGVTAILEVPVAVAQEDDAAFQREPQAIMRRSSRNRRILLPNEAMLADMLRDAGFGEIERLARHRTRVVPGYDGRFRQERLIVNAHKGIVRL